MSTNSDLDSVVTELEEFGILDEDPGTIKNRLQYALNDVATAEGASPSELGVAEWMSELLDSVHGRICDQQKGELKGDYQSLLNAGLTPGGVKLAASAILPIINLINPSFAVPTVAVYLALFLLKVGLNNWCATPRP